MESDESKKTETPADLIDFKQQSLPLIETGRDVEGLVRIIDFNMGSDEKRGPGRPAGSKNKRAEDWADYILTQYRSPLILFAETYSRSLESLQKELHCTAKEAFMIQMDAATRLAPYIHQKLPQAIEIETEKGLINLTMVISDAYADVAKARGMIIDQAQEVEIPEEITNEKAK